MRVVVSMNYGDFFANMLQYMRDIKNRMWLKWKQKKTLYLQKRNKKSTLFMVQSAPAVFYGK